MQVMEPQTQGSRRRETGVPKFTYDRDEDGQLLDADGRVVREPERARKIWQATTLPDPEPGEARDVYLATLKPGVHPECERLMLLGVDFHRFGLASREDGQRRHKKVRLSASQVAAIKERAKTEHVNVGPNHTDQVCVAELIVLQKAGAVPDADNHLDAELKFAETTENEPDATNALSMPESYREAIYAFQKEAGLEDATEDQIADALRQQLSRQIQSPKSSNGNGSKKNGKS